MPTKPTNKPSRKSLNRKRSSYISFLKRKNYQLGKEIKEYMKEAVYIEQNESGQQVIKSRLSEVHEDHLLKLARTTSLCSNFSLYSFDRPENDLTYIASGTCNHKCCFVCNWHRQKMLRRKYRNWFSENQKLNTIETKGKIKTVTTAQLDTFPDANFLYYSEYDLMHLTLTVPHYLETGFRGELFYYSQIIELFNWMRKEREWLSMVYGGEFGVETERKESGLHIHIHSLLLVKKFSGNRNALHAYVLKKWNRLTVNEFSPRTELDENTRQLIKKSNKTITDDDLTILQPKGSTIIGLETIYTISEGTKTRSREFASDAMMKAIMETISYHFEPHAFNKEDGKINIPLLADILPNVYRKILYKKFGCLHGEKSLNIKAEMDPDELAQNYREAAAIEVDEETGEIKERTFFIMNPAQMFHDKENDNRMYLTKKGKSILKPLPVENGSQAIKLMSDLITNQFKNPNRDNNNPKSN